MQNDKNMLNDSTLENEDSLQEEKTMYFDQMVTNDGNQEEATVVLDEVPAQVAEYNAEEKVEESAGASEAQEMAAEEAPAEETGAVAEVEEETIVVVEKDSTAEELPVVEETPVVEESSVVEESPVVGEASAAENVPSIDTTTPRSKRTLRRKNTPSRVYAGFFVRLTAYLLDKVIVGVPLVILRLILWTLQDVDSSNILMRKIFFSFTLTDIILYLVSIAYFVLMTYFMGRTFGKRIMKLRVVSAEDRKLTFFEVAFREIIGRYLSTVILYIGYFMIGAGDQKEALHDYLADTRVVYSLD